MPYNLKVIPEVQAYLTVSFNESTHRGDLQDLYRRRYDHVDLSRRSADRGLLALWLNQSNLLMQLLPPTCGISSTGHRDHPHSLLPQHHHHLFHSCF